MDRGKAKLLLAAISGYVALLASAWAGLVTGCDDPGGISGTPEILWQVAARSASTAPLVLESVVVFGALDGSAVGFDRQTGAMRWKQQLAQAEVWGAVRGAAGLAIVPQYEVWALDPGNGAVRWRFGGPDSAAGVHDVATAGDTVFTGSGKGWASAVDARSGQAMWSTDLGEAPFRPVVAGDLVIYGTRGFLGAGRQGPLGAGHIVALRRGDGSEAWRFPLPDSAGILGGAVSGGAVWQDRVIVGDFIGCVYALRLGDGALLWKDRNPSGYNYLNSPAVQGDVAVLMRGDNTVEARDVRTGVLRWTLEDRSSIVTGPVVAGKYVYIIEGPITIADSVGVVAWEYGGLDRLGRGLSFMNGTVTGDGTIYTLGVERLTGHDGTYVVALRPPVKP